MHYIYFKYMFWSCILCNDSCHNLIADIFIIYSSIFTFQLSWSRVFFLQKPLDYYGFWFCFNLQCLTIGFIHVKSNKYNENIKKKSSGYYFFSPCYQYGFTSHWTFFQKLIFFFVLKTKVLICCQKKKYVYRFTCIEKNYSKILLMSLLVN